jgi:hypothetical protein
MRSHASARSPHSPDLAPPGEAHRHQSAAPAGNSRAASCPKTSPQTVTDPLNNTSGSHYPRTNPQSTTDHRSTTDLPAPRVTRPSYSVAVGTAVAGRPPRRSQRAGLPHWAPALGDGGESLLRPGMQDSR